MIKFVKRAFEKLVEFELHSCALLRAAAPCRHSSLWPGGWQRAEGLAALSPGQGPLLSECYGVEVEAMKLHKS